MMRLILLIAIAALAGCENGNFTPTDAGRAREKARVQKRGDARMALFKECLTLAAKITRQADDDVSDIVKECSTQAYYATHYIE